jgi:hypothetical protein
MNDLPASEAALPAVAARAQPISGCASKTTLPTAPSDLPASGHGSETAVVRVPVVRAATLEIHKGGGPACWAMHAREIRQHWSGGLQGQRH